MIIGNRIYLFRHFKSAVVVVNGGIIYISKSVI